MAGSPIEARRLQSWITIVRLCVDVEGAGLLCASPRRLQSAADAKNAVQRFAPAEGSTRGPASVDPGWLPVEDCVAALRLRIMARIDAPMPHWMAKCSSFAIGAGPAIPTRTGR